MKYRMIAHTGCMGTPMNSLESIRRGIAEGADLIEVDVRFTDRGAPVLTHNPIERKTSYVTLEEALREISKGAGIKAALDLKEWQGHMPQLVRILKAEGMSERSVYLGNFMEDMEMMRKEGGGVPCFPNVYPEQVKGLTGERLVRLAEMIKTQGADAVGMNFIAATTPVVKAFHSQGLPVSVWTVDGKADIERMLRLNVDFITTNRADLLG